MMAMIFVFASILAGALLFAALYDFGKLNAINVPFYKHAKWEMNERQQEVKGDPEIEEKFRPILVTARTKFPTLHVWGQYILGGAGYALFFTDGVKKSAWQAKSTICIDGKTQDIDIFNSEQFDDDVNAAFESVRKSFEASVN